MEEDLEGGREKKRDGDSSQTGVGMGRCDQATTQLPPGPGLAHS
jgi:hypothetical protein